MLVQYLPVMVRERPLPVVEVEVTFEGISRQASCGGRITLVVLRDHRLLALEVMVSSGLSRLRISL